MIVVAGYSVPLCAKIINRWKELEKIVSDPAVLLDWSKPAPSRCLHTAER